MSLQLDVFDVFSCPVSVGVGFESRVFLWLLFSILVFQGLPCTTEIVGLTLAGYIVVGVLERIVAKYNEDNFRKYSISESRIKKY